MLSVLLIGAIALGFSHAPAAWHRPGPSALLFAVFSGVFIGGMAVVNRVDNLWLLFVVAFAVVALSLAGMTLERHRLHVKSLAKTYLSTPQPKNPGNMLESMNQGMTAQLLMEEVRKERKKIYEAKRPFDVYLTYRLENLGIEKKPWPVVYWIGEILLGGLLAGGIAIRWQKWQSEESHSI